MTYADVVDFSVHRVTDSFEDFHEDDSTEDLPAMMSSYILLPLLPVSLMFKAIIWLVFPFTVLAA